MKHWNGIDKMDKVYIIVKGREREFIAVHISKERAQEQIEHAEKYSFCRLNYFIEETTLLP